MRIQFALGCLVLLNTGRGAVFAAEPTLPSQVQAVFKKYCYRCHGLKQEVEGLNILDHAGLIAGKHIQPGKPEASEIWKKAGIEKKMPPEGSLQPTAEERGLIQAWISAGAAPFPQESVRRPVSDWDVLQFIRDDLKKANPPESRQFLRYFTLNNLHNNSFEQRLGKHSVNIDEKDLRLTRAGVAKVINSLSWQPSIVVPEPIDPQQTVLRIDLRDLGWDEQGLWNELLKVYPYGLRQTTDREPRHRDLAREVYELAGVDQPQGGGLPAVRADWFIDTATRGPLYDKFLHLPRNVRELEKTLKVNPESDFLRDRLVRAGFAESGVSRNNRLVDRHVATFGAYWKSYDFAKSEGRGDLFKYPLGPKFPGNPFEAQAFEHQGGEMIFNLPNGLQAYYLAKADGEQLDIGPVSIVRDLKETSGTPEVVNGLSCIACHEHGMKRFNDTIRQGLAVGGEAAIKVDRLFPEKKKMDEWLAADEKRFMEAAAKAFAQFLQVGEDASRPFADFPDPVGHLARLYQADLRLEEAAVELGFPDPKELLLLIRGNTTLRQQVGLGPLVDGAAIKRSKWADVSGFISPFQRTALELERGTPFRAR